MGQIPGLGRSPREGKGNPLQYSCLENPIDRGAWQATVHRVVKSQTWLKQLSTHKYTNNRTNGMSYQTRQLTEDSFVDPKLHSRGILGESQSFPWSQDTDIDGNRNMCSMRIPALCWYCFSPILILFHSKQILTVGLRCLLRNLSLPKCWICIWRRHFICWWRHLCHYIIVLCYFKWFLLYVVKYSINKRLLYASF